SEARYNPMSYHNGSVWPHDNALIAAGFARYEWKESTAMLRAGILDDSLFFDLHRLPELFCGFPRRLGEGPTLYPVACNPQAWASGAVFCIIQACLGLRFDPLACRLYFDNPQLPEYIEKLEIKNLKVNSAVLDVSCIRHAEDVAVNVRHRTGKVEVVVIHGLSPAESS